MSLKGKTAIVGLGITKQGKVYDTNHVGFAVEAVRLALEDAGLTRDDLDGVLVNPGLTWGDGGMGAFQLQQAMGLHNLRLSVAMSAGGATACAMIQQAAEAIDAGICNVVACVFSDTPLKPPRPKGEGQDSGGPAPTASRVVSTRRTDSSGSTRCTPWWRAVTCISTAPPTTTSAPSRWPSGSGPT
jgi:acetyl-CoA acetyltransferase